MASRELIYLDTVPIEEDLLTSNKNLTQSLEYRRQLNLALNCSQAESQLAKHQSNLNDLYDRETPVTFKDLNLAIESFLSLLISSPSIISLDQEQLTTHYSRRKILVTKQLLKPTTDYLEELLFSSARTWGTSYSSLGYFLHLAQDREHYLHPSELVHRATLKLIQQMQLTPFETIASSFYTLLEQEDSGVDLEIYRLQSRIIQDTPVIKAVYSNLEFYQSWLPQVLAWYLKSYREKGELPNIPTKPKNPEEQAMKVLEQVAQACLLNGLDDSSFNDLSYSFIHQSIPAIYFSLVDELLLIRKRASLSGEVTQYSEAEKLLQPFIESIRVDAQIGDLRSASQLILEDLAAPGGYNLFLISIAASLLNRAYILSHPTKNTYSDIEIFPLRAGLPDLLALIGRTCRLLYLAGYTLKKTTLDHLQITGANLITISGLDDASPIAIKDLSK